MLKQRSTQSRSKAGKSHNTNKPATAESMIPKAYPSKPNKSNPKNAAFGSSVNFPVRKERKVLGQTSKREVSEKPQSNQSHRKLEKMKLVRDDFDGKELQYPKTKPRSALKTSVEWDIEKMRLELNSREESIGNLVLKPQLALKQLKLPSLQSTPRGSDSRRDSGQLSSRSHTSSLVELTSDSTFVYPTKNEIVVSPKHGKIGNNFHLQTG